MIAEETWLDENTQTVIIRSYDNNGNSKDTIKIATEEEKKALRAILVGAIHCARQNGMDKQTIADTAEYIAINMCFENEWEWNSYDTVYTRIKKRFAEMEEEQYVQQFHN